MLCHFMSRHLTMNPSAGGVAGLMVDEPVPVPHTASPVELLTLLMDGVVVVTQVGAKAFTQSLLEVASFCLWGRTRVGYGEIALITH